MIELPPCPRSEYQYSSGWILLSQSGQHGDSVGFWIASAPTQFGIDHGAGSLFAKSSSLPFIVLIRLPLLVSVYPLCFDHVQLCGLHLICSSSNVSGFLLLPALVLDGIGHDWDAPKRSHGFRGGSCYRGCLDISNRSKLYKAHVCIYFWICSSRQGKLLRLWSVPVSGRPH